MLKEKLVIAPRREVTPKEADIFNSLPPPPETPEFINSEVVDNNQTEVRVVSFGTSNFTRGYIKESILRHRQLDLITMAAWVKYAYDSYTGQSLRRQAVAEMIWCAEDDNRYPIALEIIYFDHPFDNPKTQLNYRWHYNPEGVNISASLHRTVAKHPTTSASVARQLWSPELSQEESYDPHQAGRLLSQSTTRYFKDGQDPLETKNNWAYDINEAGWTTRTRRLIQANQLLEKDVATYDPLAFKLQNYSWENLGDALSRDDEDRLLLIEGTLTTREPLLRPPDILSGMAKNFHLHNLFLFKPDFDRELIQQRVFGD